MISVDDYVEIIPADSRALQGLRWSPAQDAIEYGDGQTFAHVLEVFGFLEGFAAQRPLVHFGHVLHFLYLLRHGKTPAGGHDFTALKRAWREAGRPAVTTGAFGAFLCKEVPPVSVPPSLEDLSTWLAVRSRGSEDDPFRVLPLPEEPPFTPEVFEAYLAVAVEGLGEEDLVHWFRHGQRPVKAQGEDLTQALLQHKPPTLEAVLAELSRHDRLSGAVPFVARLVSALTLPPRRLSDRELPLGGYADVTTRGAPEQILPAQFALDELEFLRRFAENELLFYRREEPGSRTREELVVLLDQGVRTWGRVRLVLAAAVFALGQLARLRKIPLLLAGTGNGGHLVDPLTGPPADLSEWLSASDLSPHPSLALEQVLSERCVHHRDVVLLTHPRNLAELDVLTSARTVSPTMRLFAVAVDAHGAVGFHELRHGAPVAIGRFHLDLDQPVSAPRPEPGGPWQGDVEPVGFPFRFGLASNHERFLFAFDQDAHLLTAAQFGMLCVTKVDGSAHEILPRCLLGGRILTEIDQVLGVSGGFVVCGSMPGLLLVAAHYDLANRMVKAYEFPVSGERLATGVEWRYLRRRHLLILRAGERFSSVHLATGERGEVVPEALRWRPTRMEALHGSTIVSLPPQEDYLAGNVKHPTDSGWHWGCPTLGLDRRSGNLWLDGVVPPWQSFIPLADGKPALAGWTLQRAECQHDVLAALFVSPNYKKQLWLFHGPQGRTITTFPVAFDRDGFTLSSDGRLLALQRGPCQLEIRGTQPAGGDVRGVTPVGRFHNNAIVELGERWLCLAVDRTIHLARWGAGRLELSLHRGDMREVLRRELAGCRLSPDGTRALPGRVPGFLRYDSVRFRLAAWRNLVAVVDCYGEVFLFEHTGDLVCTFFAFRQQMAAWMPDGACLGAEALLGRPPTPEAGRQMGLALCLAWERGEGTIT
jgi:hypothetical protein